MPKNDREVFEHLIANDETALQIDFLTYAVFAHEKREWIKLYERKNGERSPTQKEIDDWIDNLTDSQFVGMRSIAQEFFVEAATAYYEERIESEKTEILRSAIITEIRAAGALWKQIAIALLTTILAPIMIGLIIAAFYFFDISMPSATSIAKRFGPALQHDTTKDAPPVPSQTPQDAPR